MSAPKPPLPHTNPAQYETQHVTSPRAASPEHVTARPARMAPFPPAPPPRPLAAKTLTEQLSDLTAIASIAASRAEIALRSADRSEAASIRTEAAVKDLTRKTPGLDGQPGALYVIANQLAALTQAAHPVARAKVYAMTLATAALTGGLAALLTTCAHR